MDATFLAEQVATGMASPTELLEDALARVAKLNPEINAVVLVQEYTARKAIKAGLPNGPFKGVPFLIKDLGAEATQPIASIVRFIGVYAELEW
jgi:amidase